jgi:hypothetical protein
MINRVDFFFLAFNEFMEKKEENYLRAFNLFSFYQGFLGILFMGFKAVLGFAEFFFLAFMDWAEIVVFGKYGAFLETF